MPPPTPVILVRRAASDFLIPRVEAPLAWLPLLERESDACCAALRSGRGSWGRLTESRDFRPRSATHAGFRRRDAGIDRGKWSFLAYDGFFFWNDSFPTRAPCQVRHAALPWIARICWAPGGVGADQGLAVNPCGALFPTRTVLLPVTVRQPPLLPLRLCLGLLKGLRYLRGRHGNKKNIVQASLSEILDFKGLIFANAEQCS